MITNTQIKNALSGQDLDALQAALEAADPEVVKAAQGTRKVWSEAGCPIWLARASGPNRELRRHPPKDVFSRSKPRPAPRATLDHA